MTDASALDLPELDVPSTDLRGPEFRAAMDALAQTRLAAEPSYGSIQGVYGLDSLHLTWD